MSGRTDERAWKLLLAGLLLGALLIGVVIGDDFGMSVDEPDNSDVGRIAARALVDHHAFADYMESGPQIAHHGPGYFMVWEAASRLVVRLAPGWHITDGHHLVNYLTFLLGLSFFYAFARRFLERGYALVTTLLLATQPLFFGHALINQKDTPFWALFLGSVVVGLGAVDRLLAADASAVGGAGLSLVWKRIRDDLSAGWSPARLPGASLFLLSTLAALDLLFFGRGLKVIEWLVRQAHSNQAWPFVNQLYRAFARNADKVPVNAYLAELRWPYWVLRPPLLLLMISLSAAGLRWGLPRTWDHLRSQYGPHLPHFLAGGALLGFTISLRPIGAFAAGLIALHWLANGRLRGLEMALPYALASGVASYLAWPYLWEAPYRRLLESLLFIGSFDKDTLYWGRILSSDSLPWHYVPSYLAVELTEPLPILLLLGIGLVAHGLLRGGNDRPSLLLLAAWIATPLMALLVVGGGVYGNIRHLLFVVIPCLTVAGIGMAWILDRLPSKGLRGALAALLLLPGILGIVRLHPYQYTYFNSYIGGVSGAAHLHVLDRWCTSYREAMAYINREARPGAKVGSNQGQDVAKPFVREDISAARYTFEELEEGDYFLTCALRLGEMDNTPGWEKVHEVKVEGAVLAEILQKTSSGAGAE